MGCENGFQSGWFVVVWPFSSGGHELSEGYDGVCTTTPKRIEEGFTLGAGHDHGTPASSGGRHKRALFAAFLLLLAFFGVELVTGLVSGSLTLLSDAGHMLTDVLGIGMALAAIQVAGAATRDRRRSFGWYRLEILAALANAVLLAGVAIWVLVEAVQRLAAPPEIAGDAVLWVALGGLLVNVIVFRLLHAGSQESLNLEGAYLEVLADLLGSVAAVITGLVLRFTDFALIDPLFGIAIGLFVLPRTWRLGRKALRVLVQAAPEDVDVDAIVADLGAITDVNGVHDLHVWTLTSGMDVASVHLTLAHVGASHEVLHRAQEVLRDDHGIAHATVQLDPPDHTSHACDDCLTPA